MPTELTFEHYGHPHHQRRIDNLKVHTSQNPLRGRNALLCGGHCVARPLYMSRSLQPIVLPPAHLQWFFEVTLIFLPTMPLHSARSLCYKADAPCFMEHDLCTKPWTAASSCLLKKHRFNPTKGGMTMHPMTVRRLKNFAAYALFSCSSFAMAAGSTPEILIDFSNARGSGTSVHNVLIENIRVTVPIINPFQPGSYTSQVNTYNVNFKFDPATLHLIPVGIAENNPNARCADVSVMVYDALRGQAGPIANAVVTLGGQSVSTNSSGVASFTDIAPPGEAMVQVSAPGYNSVSQVATLNCLGQNTLSVALSPSGGSGSIRAGQFRAILTWGENPRDLDSHMTGPGSSGERWHVYYSNRQAGDMCALDVDDTTSYGPETITCPLTGDGSTQLRPGVYRYSVHHYSGSGTINTSGANVRLELPGGQQYTFTPPTNQTYSGSNDVWTVFELTVNNDGTMSVAPVDSVYSSSASSVRSGNTPGATRFGQPEDAGIFSNLSSK